MLVILGTKICLRGNFGRLLEMLVVSPYFQRTYPERRGFQIYHTNLPMLTIKSFACHDSLDPLFQTLDIWIQGSEATGHVSSATYFSNLLEDKDRKFKIKLTLSLILRVNLRLGGLLHMECEFNRTPYREDWTTTRGMSTSQPRRSQRSTRKTFQDEV
jgi:hypothetical protein